MIIEQQMRSVLLALGGAIVFWCSGLYLKGERPRQPNPEIEVALPPFVQVTMAFGDRYLASNFESIRALVTDPEKMSRADFEVLARVQLHASWLNPAHEDNYYTAAGILPWYGQLSGGQKILRRAAEARKFDYQPSLYYAFNLFHFEKKPLDAAMWLQRAAGHLNDENERIAMQELASRWAGQTDNLLVSAQLVEAMASNSKNASFRSHLDKRAKRLRIIIGLRDAVNQYRVQEGASPKSIAVLVASGLIKDIPIDPLGGRFIIGSDGKIEVLARGENE